MTAFALPRPLPADNLLRLFGDPARFVTRACACGGYLTADPAASFHAVARHNRTVEHMAWWARVAEEWQG